MDKINTRRKGQMERMNFTVDAAAKDNLDKLKEFYRRNLGKDVSMSLIVRRAFEVLVDYINSLQDEVEVKDELLTLLKQAG